MTASFRGVVPRRMREDGGSTGSTFFFLTLCCTTLTQVSVLDLFGKLFQFLTHRCHAANLNGKFYHKGKYKAQYDNGVVWGTWKGLWYSLRHTTMKVRPLLFLDSVGSGLGEI